MFFLPWRGWQPSEADLVMRGAGCSSSARWILWMPDKVKIENILELIEFLGNKFQTLDAIDI
jgi:hypothetical protein